MADLDHFNSVNDSDGHQAGDRVLQQVAQLLRDCTRESDAVARRGGEQFAIVGRQASVQEGTALVERIRSRFDRHEFDLGDGRTIRRSCSAGFALADQCRYIAKRSGRNTWVGVLPCNELIDSEAKVEAVCQRQDADLAGLVAEGLLCVQSSRPAKDLTPLSPDAPTRPKALAAWPNRRPKPRPAKPSLQ